MNDARRAADAQRALWAEQAARYVSPELRATMFRQAGDAFIKGITDRRDAQRLQRQRQYWADWQRSQRAY
jgi:hypothetical protein